MSIIFGGDRPEPEQPGWYDDTGWEFGADAERVTFTNDDREQGYEDHVAPLPLR